MNNEFSQLTEDFLYCYRNELLNDEVGQAMRHIYDAGICDDTISHMFEKRVSKHKFCQAFYGIMPFKTPTLTKGDYIIGYDQNNWEIRSCIQYMNAHTLTIAGSGAGKTNLSRFKILQVAPRIAGLWLFDLRKSEFALLKSRLAKIGISLLIIPARVLRLNPLQLPEGVTVQNWIPRVADMLVQVLELPPRASKLLQAKLFCLYQRFQQDTFPTLYDLFELVKNDKQSNPQARMAVLDSLEPVLRSLGPRVLAYRYGWSSSELVNKHICFQLAGTSEADKNLILNSLVLSEFTSRIARWVSNPSMDLLINVDEAQRLCSSASQSSAIADLIGLVRGTGIGLDMSLQSTYDLLPQIISNTATKVMGRCGSIADYTAAGHSMGLNADHIQWAQMNLEPGMFIGQLGEGLLRHPFVFHVPLINCPRLSINEQMDMESLSNLPTVYASEFDSWGSQSILDLPELSSSKERLFDSEQEYSFCKAVVSQPMQPSSTYPKLAGISSKSAKKVRAQLMLRSYIREHTVDSGCRGRSSILLEALPAGIQAVQKYEEN